MKARNSPTTLSLLALSGGLLAPAVQGALIAGSLGIAGSASLNTTSASTATAASGFSAFVASKTGSFASLPANAAVTFVPGSWNFNTSAPIANFWTVGGFRFELTSSHIVAQGGGSFSYVTVGGSGIVSGNGYTPTAFSWSFVAQDPPYAQGQWTFSISNTSQNTNGAPVLRNVTSASHSLVLAWTDPTFNLQCATNAAGPFTNLTTAKSPYTNDFAGAARFFRLVQP